MTGSIDHATAAPRLVLDGECCIDSLAPRRDAMLAALRTAADVAVDAGELSKIDTAGLQLLVALALDLRRAQRNLVWLGASAALIEAAQLAGLCELLGLPQA